MAKNKKQSTNKNKTQEQGRRYILNVEIAEDQRKYIEGVREWLRDSLKNKGKVVGGPA